MRSDHAAPSNSQESLSSELEIYMSSFSTPVRWRAVTVVQATGRTDWFRKNTNTDQAGWVSGVL